MTHLIPWTMFTPTVFRLMEREYVERFFETGELMLSSFLRFSQHKDEERNDKEGEHIIVGLGTEKYSVCRYGVHAP